MSEQKNRAEQFASLHVKGRPIVLFNIWDAGSARAVASAGALALATGSWSVAAAHGYSDGEKVPLPLVLANLERIVAAVDVPVTLDFESGYGATPADIEASIAKVLNSGAIGVNIEDQILGSTGLYSIEDQCARLRGARAAAQKSKVPLFINARTDVFLKAAPASHDELLLQSALQRANAYAKAGASGLFVPGLVDETLIAKLCGDSPLPVNVMMTPNAPSSKRSSELGVSRISHGPGPYRLAMRALEEAARQAMA